MKNNDQPPKIRTIDIFLVESNFIRFPEISAKIKPTVGLDYKYSIDGDVGQGVLTANVDCVNEETLKKMFEARIRYVGIFQQDPDDPNMGIDDFTREVAPAHIFPYIREYLTSLSTRSNMPTIILPAMNVAAMTKIRLVGDVTDSSLNLKEDKGQ